MQTSVPLGLARLLSASLPSTYAIGRTLETTKRRHARSAGPSGDATRRVSTGVAAAVAVALVLMLTGAQAAAARPAPDTGFSMPYSGPAKYEYLAPKQAKNSRQINKPIGLKRANKIAAGLGLSKKHVLKEWQYLAFISGKGLNGSGDPESAKLADQSVRIFTNTTGRPLSYDTVLGSYGLFVNEEGMLMSLANLAAPTRIANELLVPGGYVNTWFLANRAKRSLVQLYRSGYTVEAFYGNQAQQLKESYPAQLVPNTRKGVSTQVGMSMAPALWLTNFALLYTLKPEIAAKMPAYWTPIPADVADAILASPNGQVRWSEYEEYFE